jgi:hypothetical protein
MSAPRRTLTSQEVRILQPALVRYYILPPYSSERHDFLNSIVALLQPIAAWTPMQVRHWFRNNKNAYLPTSTPAQTATPSQVLAEIQKLRDLVTEGFTRFDSLWNIHDLPIQPDPTLPLLPLCVESPIPKPVKSRPAARVQSPDPLELEGSRSNASFQEALQDSTLVCHPVSDGFLPTKFWLDTRYTFGEIVQTFFQRKSNVSCRFPHKLYNALTLVDKDPKYYDFIGVQWITDRIFKVDKFIFGRLLGLTAIDGGLFHHQGNFPTHGFIELSSAEADALRETCDLSELDLDRVRLLFNPTNAFYRNCDEASIANCKWITEGE